MKYPKNNGNKPQFYPVTVLREDLRTRSVALTGKLARSVARLTSCDLLPCMEYGDEVSSQRALAQELFYCQQCRTALERCIGCGGAVLRHRWPSGAVTQTRFRMVSPSRVKVTGLVEEPGEALLPAQDH